MCLTIDIMYVMNFWLHNFLSVNGASMTLRPCYIITSVNPYHDKNCVVPFVTYVQTHEDNENSMSPCTILAIYLCPTGNYQGSHYLLILQTGHQTNYLH